MLRRPEVSRVFASRSTEVDHAMYVRRELLERELLRGLDGHKHLVICGASGIGKSWMYKFVLAETKRSYRVIDCAQVARVKSFERAFEQLLAKHVDHVPAGLKSTLKGTANVVAFGGEINSERHFESIDEPFLNQLLSVYSKQKVNVVIFENFERLLDYPELLTDFCNILMLLDNDYFSDYNIKFLFVGAITQVAEFYRRISLQYTVANRIKEVPINKGLPKSGLLTFVKRGFNEKLRMNLSENGIARIVERAHYVSLGMPQRLHEFCFELAEIFKEENFDIYEDNLVAYLNHAEARFARGSLIKKKPTTLCHGAHEG